MVVRGRTKLPYIGCVQGRRNRGGGGSPSALFPGVKCPFLAWKMSLRLHFWKLELMLFPEIFFHLREKYHISRKIFGISGKFLSYLGKNVLYPENFFDISGKFFWDDLPPPPRRQHLREKTLDVLFYSKSARQSLAPPNF